eukprot:GHVN01040301.1.p1 GENE.GHVN01040301.1~~GHVN01040301.1.p1  ORF type:complete len:375 (+),score=70.59 GHVN01040301.1:194-1318(+)
MIRISNVQGLGFLAVCVVGGVGLIEMIRMRKRRRRMREVSEVCKKMKGRDLLSIDSVTSVEVSLYVEIAQLCKNALQTCKADKLLAGKCLSLLFCEPSTRTRCSFESAMKRLGGNTLGVCAPAMSSVSKGESIGDTARMLSAYSDAIVVRHPDLESAAVSSAASSVPVVNGGNGAGEHPTQALLDLFTIATFFPSVLEVDFESPPLRIALVGDLINGRTTHSLVKLLARYNTTFTYVAPDILQITPGLMAEVELAFEKNGAPSPHSRQKRVEYLSEALMMNDIIYMTRIQRERFESEEKYNETKNSCVLTSEMLDEFAPETTKVLHPLPRLNEIAEDVDNNHRAAYFKQAENGLYMRMAILTILFGQCEKLFCL